MSVPEKQEARMQKAREEHAWKGAGDLKEYYATEFYAERPEYLVEPEGVEKEWVEAGFGDMLALLDEHRGEDLDAWGQRRLVDFGAGKGHFGPDGDISTPAS